MTSIGSCSSAVPVLVSKGYSYKEVVVSCGSTGIGGQTILCDTCISFYNDKYPQGWKNHPGDICIHGIYHNPDHDCACGLCEDSIE